MMAIPAAKSLPAESPLQPRRFSVDEYYRMAQADILRPDERVELIEGEIITMAPIGPAHSSYVNTLAKLLIQRFDGLVHVSIQNPIRLANDTEPQPDIVLVKLRKDHYLHAHPHAEDVYLVIEISQSSLDYDRSKKCPLYACAGIPEVWIIDIASNTIEQYRDPQNGAYTARRRYQKGAEITLHSFPQIHLQTEAILLQDSV